MAPSDEPLQRIRWPFESAPPSKLTRSLSSSNPSTSPTADNQQDEESEPSSAGSSPNHPVEGESDFLSFVGQHPNLTLQAGQLPSNTSGPRSASPLVVAAPLVTSQEQSVEPETAKAEEQVRPSIQRSSLALSGVSVRSRIAAFENQSPTASTFGLSPPRPGNVDLVSGSLPVALRKQEESSALVSTIPDLDFSDTNFPSFPPRDCTESDRRGFAPLARGETASPLTTPSFGSRKNYGPLRLPPEPPLRATEPSSQSPSQSPKTELLCASRSELDNSELPEQPKTPRLGVASLDLPIRSKSTGSEKSYFVTFRPQGRLQIPSFGRHLPLGSPLERVKRNEDPGPRPRAEHALARQNRYKRQSRLSHVFRADSPVEESPELYRTEVTPFDESRRLRPVPEGATVVERSSSTRRNRTATLRSLEGLGVIEDQATSLTTESVDKESGWPTGFFPQTALVPKPLRPDRTTVAGPESKFSDQKDPISSKRADTEHPNLSDFSFSFDTSTQQASDTAENVQRKPKPTLLPSLLPHPGYSTPPSSPGLSEAEAQTSEFSVPAVEETSNFHFEKPDLPQAITPFGYSFGSGPYHEPPYLGLPHQFPPRGFHQPPHPSAHLLRPSSSKGRIAPTEGDRLFPLDSEDKLLRFYWKQFYGIEADASDFSHYQAPSREFSDESSEISTPSPTEAEGPELPVIVFERAEQITPRITRTLIQHRLRPSDSGSESGSDVMDHLRPESALAVTHHRREAIRLAKVQETGVVEKCRRSGAAIPDYTFDELIGKGSFGRVYKCRKTTTRSVVAVKVIDIDESDFRAHGEEKEEQIRAFQKEIKILRQAQESGAPNLNLMIEALPVHSQLWLVCDYCPGGSVKTLMRATNDRLIEKFIVVIARELGKALKGLHAAGILHRDIKAANVLIHEEGRLQLCDFGVATVMETKLDKRRTFIGTLHWMPPEMWDREPEYSDEVDVWAFGCAIYECAIGRPPNSDLREPQQLKSRMRRLNKSIELPESEDFPEALRSLVSYTLTPDAKNRPTMRDVLKHEYLANTEESHPTNVLTELVNLYYTWLHGGGQRASLFIKGGAAVSEAPGALSASNDDWNFSTTIDFEKRISSILDIEIDIPEIGELPDSQSAEGESTPKAIKDSAQASEGQEMTESQKANFEARVRRGADLSNVFDLNKPNYEYKTKTDFRPIQERRVSDLPLRVMAEDRPPSIASNEIDLGDFDSSNYATVAPLTKLVDASTIRAKRDDLKLSRENSSTKSTPSINISAAGAAADDYLAQQESTERPATQDFSFPPKEWKQDVQQGLATDAAQFEDDVPKKSSVRKTMEWSFDTAMSETEPDEPDEPEPAVAGNSRSKKHATMQWSFPQAMAEAGASSTLSNTPARPAPMLRTITMPVTSSEIDAAEADVPRPSTALSEAVSERSMASSEADPFGLDQDAPGYPEPSALDQRGMSAYYHSEGNTLSPEHTVPYNTTIAGPAPYPMGPPARIGEEGFPGPTNTTTAATPVTQSGKKQKKKKRRFTRSKKSQTLTSDEEVPATSSSSESASPGTRGSRQLVTMPEITPPAAEALDVNASLEHLERELGSMLGNFGAVLSAAGRVMGIGRRSRRSSRRSSSEWESED